MIISHVKISLFKQSPIIASGHFILVENTWVPGNARFISRVEHDISHSFPALTRQISCSTLEINLVFPRTRVLFST